jgi:hypothetical protein
MEVTQLQSKASFVVFCGNIKRNYLSKIASSVRGGLGWNLVNLKGRLHCFTTSWKVAASIPDEVVVFFT